MSNLFTLSYHHHLHTMLFVESSLQAPPIIPPSFNTLDYTLDHNNLYPPNHHQHLMKFQTSSENNNGSMVDYMPQTPPPPPLHGFYGTNSTSSTTPYDKLSFADVMQFADFGPKLALNQTKNCEETGIDPVYFLKFPVLNDKIMEEEKNMLVSDNNNNNDPDGETENHDDERFNVVSVEDKEEGMMMREDDETTRVSDDNNNNNNNSSVQIRFLGHENHQSQKNCAVQENKNKRKRSRTVKTTEEVESQRMTHIAVERNRRKQMNEHLRVLRSLMPGSYVQRVINYAFKSFFYG